MSELIVFTQDSAQQMVNSDERVGKYNVKHYEVNDQLDTAIKTYFGLKHALK